MNSILHDISEIHPKKGEFVLCRLGQHSFLLKLGEIMIAFDPYLSDEPARLLPPAFSPEELHGIKLILCSHDHGDHIDRTSLPAMAKASPEALFCVPEVVRTSITEIPQSRLCGMNEGDKFQFEGVEVFAVASAHEFLDQTSEGNYPYLGYIVRGNGVTLYHAGDCCVYEGLLTKLKHYDPDVMLLPINGRDAWRFTHDCIGNMTWQEAADLAGWCNTKLVIPGHYDMFSGNTVDPNPFLQYVLAKYPKVGCRILSPGAITFFKIEALY